MSAVRTKKSASDEIDAERLAELEAIAAAVGRLAVVGTILKTHRERFWAPRGFDPRDEDAADHPDGEDLNIAIEQLSQIRGALAKAGGVR
jgi:hypothetical protein